MTSIIIFSIKVASVIGNLIAVPRHAQSILFLSRKVLITPMVVIDNITNVIRGDDHTSNTAVQIEIINALDENKISFAHHALLKASTGDTLSKRDNVCLLYTSPSPRDTCASRMAAWG